MIYRVVFHLDQNDQQVLNLALNNVTNLLRALPEQHYDAVMLFNGPAVNLLYAETCEAADRIATLQEARVSFKACRNALANFDIEPSALVKGCQVIPAGITALIELQQDGYAYIKP
ncbi:MAG: DsrE family protein [Desulfobulbus sp.]|jgi:intracellular sulfur oxidation DsrE/DsrF family protein